MHMLYLSNTTINISKNIMIQLYLVGKKHLMVVLAATWRLHGNGRQLLETKQRTEKGQSVDNTMLSFVIL